MAKDRLVIDGVSKRYGGRPVLRDIVAEVQAGDVLLVTGPNGIGKSTLLRLLAGLQQPSDGTIAYELGGTVYDPIEARVALGFVGSDVHLYRELTAHEHLRFVVDVRGLPREGVDRALDDVGLAGRGDELVGAFSSGMQQRLRYALALLHGPAVLLLDEPTTNLDAAGIALAARIISEQRSRGITVIATNDDRDRRFGDFVLSLGEA